MDPRIRWRTTREGTDDRLELVEARGIGSGDVPRRTVRVALPPSYREGSRRYPVMYLHDGQNVFADGSAEIGKTWAADAAAHRLAVEGLEVVLVAIDHGDAQRINEYSPWHEPRFGEGGRGAAYSRFVMETAKPLVEAEFRVETSGPMVAMGGSSLGGLLALFTALTTEGTVGFCAALSPAVWYGNRGILDVAKGADCGNLRCYLDIGSKESEKDEDNRIDIDNVVAMERALKACGADSAFVLEPGANHSEAAWRRRFPAALAWFIDPSRRPPQST